MTTIVIENEDGSVSFVDRVTGRNATIAMDNLSLQNLYLEMEVDGNVAFRFKKGQVALLIRHLYRFWREM